MIRFVFLAFMLFTLMACGGGGGLNTRPSLTVPVDPPAPSLSTVALQTQTGPPATDVADYLYTHTSGGPWQSGPDYTWSHPPGLVRFTSTPTVRIAQSATSHERAITQYAVALINQALPYADRLRFGPDAPSGVDVEDVPTNQLFVEFVDRSPGGGRPLAEAGANQDITHAYDAGQQREEKQTLRASNV